MNADEQVWKIRVLSRRDKYHTGDEDYGCIEVHEAPNVQNVQAARHQARVMTADRLEVPLTTLRTEVVHEG